MTAKELLVVAKKDYPIGTKFLDMKTNIERTVEGDYKFNCYGKSTDDYVINVLTPKEEWELGASNPPIYTNNKWAIKLETMPSDLEESETYESPYCPICSGCGEEGCCSPLNCSQDLNGHYCQTYLRDLKFGYKMYDEISKLLNEDPKYKDDVDIIFNKVYNEIYRVK